MKLIRRSLGGAQDRMWPGWRLKKCQVKLWKGVRKWDDTRDVILGEGGSRYHRAFYGDPSTVQSREILFHAQREAAK